MTPQPRRRLLGGRRLDVPIGVLGAVLLWGTAAVHLHLYAIGYDRIAVIGRLFLLQGVVGSIMGVLILVTRHFVAYLGGAGYMVASIGGFLTSIWFGLFGFRDSFAAPYAGLAMAIEISGAVACLGAAGLWLRQHRGSHR